MVFVLHLSFCSSFFFLFLNSPAGGLEMIASRTLTNIVPIICSAKLQSCLCPGICVEVMLLRKLLIIVCALMKDSGCDTGPLNLGNVVQICFLQLGFHSRDLTFLDEISFMQVYVLSPTYKIDLLICFH